MWNLGRNKKTPEASEFLFPSKKEFWLICGEFRDWSTGRNKLDTTASAVVLQILFVRQKEAPARSGFTNIA